MVKMLRSTLKPPPERVRLAALTISVTKRTRGTTWAKIRARILKRDGGLCQPCLEAGRPHAATQVDHMLALADGGTDDESNLQAICADCHAEKTKAEAKARQAGGGQNIGTA